MLRHEIAQALVTAADFFSALAKGKRRGFKSLWRRAQAARRQHSSSEHAIRLLGLDSFLLASYWRRVAASKNPAADIEDLALLMRSLADVFASNQTSAALAVADGISILVLRIPEGDDQSSQREHTSLSSAGRLAHFLTAVSELYDAACILGRLQPAELLVHSCDSGSDKLFTFLGLPGAMRWMHRFVAQLVDRLFFPDETRIRKQIENVATTLPLIGQINSLKESGALSATQAKRVTRLLINGSTRFLSSGAIPADLEDPVARQRAVLTAQHQKLLLPRSTVTPERFTFYYRDPEEKAENPP